MLNVVGLDLRKSLKSSYSSSLPPFQSPVYIKDKIGNVLVSRKDHSVKITNHNKNIILVMNSASPTKY